MKEDIKNILAVLWYVRGFILTFIGIIGYIVLAFMGHYKLSIMSLIIALVNILLHLLYKAIRKAMANK